MGDARDHAFQNAPVPRARALVIEPAEADRVHHRNGPRAHGEDVAKDPADARCRPLKRLNETGMIVRLDLEGDRVAIADVDDARHSHPAPAARACPRPAAFSDGCGSFYTNNARSTSRRRCQVPSRWVHDPSSCRIFWYSVGCQLMGSDHFRRDLAHDSWTAADERSKSATQG